MSENSIPPTRRRHRWPWVALAVLAVVIAACTVAPQGGDRHPAAASQATQSAPATQDPDAGLSVSQRNAVTKAHSYLAYMAFSRSGLITQLKYDGYPDADATLAVDRVSPDWNAQASKKAQEYTQAMPFSHSGLVTQLEYDGFTAAQAEYGVQQAGL